MCRDSEICETILKLVGTICGTFLAAWFLFGIYRLIESPSKDEKMADKVYSYVHSRTDNTGVYLPINSTEFSDSVKEMFK